MTTSVALGVPLHFASSSAVPITGPIPPKDWRQKWHRSASRVKGKSKASTGTDQNFDEDWPEDDLERWVTCMTSWEEKANNETEQLRVPRSPTFSMYVADENGQSVDVEPTKGQHTQTNTKSLGGNDGGLRIAIGTQNGSIWIFSERKARKMALSASANIDIMTRSASRSSITLESLKSPLLAGRHGIEADAFGSPKQAVASMSDVTVIGSTARNTSSVDVEERLETQWHAGRENHSVVGGMMEVLGLNHSNSHLNHSHPLSHVSSHANSENHSGSSTPPSQVQLRRKLKNSRKDSTSSNSSVATSQGSPTVSIRPRTVSTATSAADYSEKSRLSNLMGSSMHPHKASRAGVEAKEVDEVAEVVKSKAEKGVIEKVEPIAILQSPFASPIVSLTKLKDDRLASLQEDGNLIIWSLRDAIPLHSVDLNTAKGALMEIEVETPAPTTSSANSPAAASLSAFAALRSTNASPVPRSRSNSNATQPIKAVLESLAIYGVSKMHSMRKVEGHNNLISQSLLLCFDEIKGRAIIVDASSGNVLAVQVLPDCKAVPLVGRFVGEGDCVEVIYIDSKSSIKAQNVRIAVAGPSLPPIEHIKHGPLSFAATAFLRREGLSNANSRAASITEAKTDCQDLGNGGVKGFIEGLEMIGEKVLLVWTDESLHVLRRVADSLILADSIVIKCPSKVTVQGQLIMLETEADLLVLKVENGSSMKNISQTPLSRDHDTQSLSISEGHTLRCSIDMNDDRLRLECSERTMWQGQILDKQIPTVTASLPFSMERIVMSLSSGYLVMCSLADLVLGKMPGLSETSPHHKGTVTMLRLVINPRTQAKHIVGGTEEGDIIFWDAITLKKQSERSLLSCPVSSMLVLGKDDNTLRLNGCLACVGVDGSLVTFLLDGLTELYTIPGRGVAMEELAVRADELLLIYEDARARVWDMRTLELRRSIGLDQAKALLDDGKGWWTRFSMGSMRMKSEYGSTGVLSSIYSSRDATAGTMMANLRKAIEAASRMVASSSSVTVSNNLAHQGDVDETGEVATVMETHEKPATLSIDTMNGKKALQTLRSLIHCLMPLGLDAEGDAYAAKLLDLTNPKALPWIQSGTASSTGQLVLSASTKSSRELLSLSPTTSTIRLLGLTAMLLVLRNITELQDTAFKLLTMLGSLPSLVGVSYQSPSLAMLTDYIADSVNEIQQASQTLFTAKVKVMSQEDLDSLCDEWIEHLPSRAAFKGELTNKAVLLLGLVSVEKYLMLPPLLLKEVANSISLFLHDDTEPAHQSTAISLCDRGFTIFQHYFDAMDVVRTLFSLSTSKGQDGKEETSSAATAIAAIAGENRGLARRATLRIAQDNTPLFMTTLSLDILHAQSPAHCDATMKLVALMVRKRPLILYPNLPRLAEAVVKSLDPTVTSMRSVIHRSATIIISELVATYSTIAFYKELQRLAVGTFEGAIIMYDLKTSTRLYVIEAHHSSLSGLSFSSDGRRLVSICLADNKVKVWKTGVGFSSFLSFGGAPRQGNLLSATSSTSAISTDPESTAKANSNGATNAYKTFEFGRLIEGDASKEADDLNLITFEWTGPRNVRVQVGETRLSFDAR